MIQGQEVEDSWCSALSLLAPISSGLFPDMKTTPDLGLMLMVSSPAPQTGVAIPLWPSPYQGMHPVPQQSLLQGLQSVAFPSFAAGLRSEGGIHRGLFRSSTVSAAIRGCLRNSVDAQECSNLGPQGLQRQGKQRKG